MTKLRLKKTTCTQQLLSGLRKQNLLKKGLRKPKHKKGKENQREELLYIYIVNQGKEMWGIYSSPQQYKLIQICFKISWWSECKEGVLSMKKWEKRDVYKWEEKIN